LRYLQCRDIEIDTLNQTLYIQGEISTLAPKVYDLLLYFCQNSDRVITKDELMEQVWAGTLVTENAISRTLVKVRKALGDDPKSPIFIKTVPRKGYRMAEAFNASDNSLNKLSNSSLQAAEFEHQINKQINHSLHYRWMMLFVGFFLILLVTYWVQKPTVSTTATVVKPLSREVGQELFPSMSPDLTQIAYTKAAQGVHDYLIIQDSNTLQKVEIKKTNFHLSKVVWSSNSEQIAFLAKSQRECVIILADINTVTDESTWKHLINCGSGSSPHFTFTHDDEYLLFNDRLSAANGYQIFKVNLLTGRKETLNQPITAGKGNYAFDLSPDGKTLVILNSEYEPITAIYTLELENAKLQRTGRVNYLMRSVTFHHDNESMVHPSPHPAYEVWQSSLSGHKLSVIASNTSRVKHIQRINNEQDYVFVSYLLNRDVAYRSINGDNRNFASLVTKYNSSVMDYLPALANGNDTYAFVSKRSSGAQVYFVEDTPQGPTKPLQLTNFEHHVKLYHLSFSPDDKQLIVLADNQLFIIELLTKEIKKLAFDNMSIQGVSWLDEDNIMFSTIKGTDWAISSYNIVSDTLGDIATDYQGGIYVPQLNQFALISNENGEVRLLNSKGEITQSLSLTCQPSMISRKVNIHLIGQSLVCNSSAENQLMSVSLESNNLTQWQDLPTPADFSVNKNGILYTQMTQEIADVMRTASN